MDCDLKSFFDTVNHERLMNLVKQRVTDSRVLRLIGRYLRAGVMLPGSGNDSIQAILHSHRRILGVKSPLD